METPKINDEFDNEGLVEACIDLIRYVGSDDFNEDKLGTYENSIYERALSMVYDDPFKFINSKL